MKREHLILGVVILVLLSPVGVVVAQTITGHSATAGTPYVTNSDVQVTLGDDREVDIVSKDDITVVKRHRKRAELTAVGPQFLKELPIPLVCERDRSWRVGLLFGKSFGHAAGTETLTRSSNR